MLLPVAFTVKMASVPTTLPKLSEANEQSMTGDFLPEYSDTMT